MAKNQYHYLHNHSSVTHKLMCNVYSSSNLNLDCFARELVGGGVSGDPKVFLFFLGSVGDILTGAVSGSAHTAKCCTTL